jgi:hypothetical protein
MNYLGDFNTGVTVRIHFTTHAAAGGLVAPSSAFAAADFRIYKDGSATEKTTTNGVSVTSPYDSIAGRHLIEIDTSNNTGDTGFFAAGSDYRVELNSAKTVDGIAQSGVVIGTFSIANRFTNLIRSTDVVQVDESVKSLASGSNPRLFFRAWQSNGLPFTTATASAITSATYQRFVNGRWSAGVSVGSVVDGSNSTSWAAGTLIRDADDLLGNLYSIDVPTAAIASGATAVRFAVQIQTGTATTPGTQVWNYDDRTPTPTSTVNTVVTTGGVTGSNALRFNDSSNYRISLSPNTSGTLSFSARHFGGNDGLFRVIIDGASTISNTQYLGGALPVNGSGYSTISGIAIPTNATSLYIIHGGGEFPSNYVLLDNITITNQNVSSPVFGASIQPIVAPIAAASSSVDLGPVLDRLPTSGRALATLGSTAPTNWIDANSIAASAMNGKGDWAAAGAAMALTSGERDTLAGVIDSRLLNAGDATDLIASIVTRIGNTNVDQAAFVAAVKGALFDTSSAANKLAVDSSGRVTIGSNADKTGYSLVTAPLDAAGTRAALGLASANLDNQLSTIDSVVDTMKLVTDKIDTALQSNGASGFQFTTLALANAPSGGGGGGGASAADIYTYFTSSGRADAFKATGFSTFNPATDQVIVGTNNDKTNYQLSAATMASLFDDTNAASLLADFFTGLNQRFDNAADIPPTIIATAVWAHSSRTLTSGAGLDAVGIRSAVGLTSADLGARLTAIAAATDTDDIADAVAERIGSIGLSLQALNGLSDGETLTVYAGDDYTDIHSQRINITSTANLSGMRLLICATHQSKNTRFTLAANIQGTTGAHFVTFNPPAELTETWDTGTWTLQYKLELELNKNKTLQSGTLIVRPFDAGTPIVEL